MKALAKPGLGDLPSLICLHCHVRGEITVSAKSLDCTACGVSEPLYGKGRETNHWTLRHQMAVLLGIWPLPVVELRVGAR